MRISFLSRSVAYYCSAARRCMLLLTVVLTGKAVAQTFPDLSLDSSHRSNVSFTNTSNAYCEVPPWVIKGSWHQYFFTTAWTKTWASPTSLAEPTTSINFSTSGYGPFNVLCQLSWWNGFLSPASLPAGYHWRRQYNGIFSVHHYTHSTQGSINLAFTHGENKNERQLDNSGTGQLYANTFDTSYPPVLSNPATYSGYAPGSATYLECWRAYHATVNLAWLPNTAATDWGNGYYYDHGPFVWPYSGYYHTDGSKSSSGLRHPTSVTKGDSIYVYYIDSSVDNIAPGVPGSGIKVAKAHLNDAIDPLKWYVYTASGWVASLPSGFTKETMLNYVKVNGPASASLIYEWQMDPVRFSVAKIKGTDYYLGAKLFLDYSVSGTSPAARIGLYLSKDMVTWSSRKLLVDDVSGGWEASELHYPIFLNKTGDNNEEIDLDDFYIIGSRNGTSIGRLHLKLSFVTPLARTQQPAVPQIKQTTEMPVALSLMGNPLNTDEVHLLLEGNTKPASRLLIEVFDLKGRLCKSKWQPAGGKQLMIKVNELPAGMYIVRLRNEKGTVVANTVKFIK
ncbi:T9SS type A sorting domain-containing protein [Chitinophaga defluvii]|uniref:T9SS type A sorting domain-containing protein n=1 Tax=Chitinophaga defluvii TaxID=3163343 RepID=A0ABV2T3A6_9BACT